MGTVFRIVACVADSAAGHRAVDAAFARVSRLDSVLSDYAPDSEVSRIAATYRPGVPVGVSDDLALALDAADTWNERTGGTFDAALGALTRVWRRAVRRGVLPDAARLEPERAASGWHHVNWDPLRRTLVFDVSDVRLDFGGIGKGLAADEALAVLESHGIRSAIVDAGGDVRAGAAPPGSAGWIVALPEESGGGRVWLADAALATSGSRYRHVDIDGVRWSHILDPETGLGLHDDHTVTVFAADAVSADVLATTLSAEREHPAAHRARGMLLTGPGGDREVIGRMPETVPPDTPRPDCAARTENPD